jgi:hypothetical protein
MTDTGTPEVFDATEVDLANGRRCLILVAHTLNPLFSLTSLFAFSLSFSLAQSQNDSILEFMIKDTNILLYLCRYGEICC